MLQIIGGIEDNIAGSLVFVFYWMGSHVIVVVVSKFNKHVFLFWTKDFFLDRFLQTA